MAPRGAVLRWRLKRVDENFFRGDAPLRRRWQFSTKRTNYNCYRQQLILHHFCAFLAAVWGLALPPEAVRQNFEAGLPNSRPIARDVNITMNEDGEHPRCGGVGPGGSGLSSYDLSKPVGIEAFRHGVEPVMALGSIELLVHDQDNDPRFKPNYRPGLAELQPTRCLITRLPELGTLYQSTPPQESIVKEGIEVRANANGSFLVHYRPWKDAHSTTLRESGVESESSALMPFDSFLYKALDGVTGLTSSEAGTTTITVKPCNDPPIATNGTKITAFSATTTALPLNGSDVDGENHAEIAAAFITRLPSAEGSKLLQWTGRRYTNISEIPHRVDFGTRGIMGYEQSCSGAKDDDMTANNDPDVPMISRFVGCLAYRYEGPEALRPVDEENTMLVDRIQFFVQDTAGANSTPAIVDIAVRMALTASSSVDIGAKHSVAEATRGNVTLGGAADQSDLRRPVAVRITRLPAHGQLYDQSLDQELSFVAVASRLPSSRPTHHLLSSHTTATRAFFTLPLKYDGTALDLNLSTS